MCKDKMIMSWRVKELQTMAQEMYKLLMALCMSEAEGHRMPLRATRFWVQRKMRDVLCPSSEVCVLGLRRIFHHDCSSIWVSRLLAIEGLAGSFAVAKVVLTASMLRGLGGLSFSQLKG